MRRITVRQGARKGCAALLRDCDGAIAVITALALPAILGLAALGSEVGTWYVAKRTMQGAADSAAFTAATDVMMGDTSGYAAAARSATASYHFIDGSNNTTVTVNKPPASGPYSTNNSAVEVIIQQTRTPLLVHGLLPSLTLTARAVAIAGNTASSCVLALDPSVSGAITANGNPTVNLNCGIATNSSSSSALLLNGNATINATSASIVGNILTNGPSHLNTPDTQVGASPTADPYQNVPVPSYGGCDHASTYIINGTGTFHLQPGVYCGGISINGNVTVVLDAGPTPDTSIYVMNNGSFSVNGTVNLSGDGVSVVLTSSTHSNYGSLTMNGTVVANLTAPSSGPMAGFVFYQDRNAPSGADSFNGNPGSTLGGVLYFPSQQVTYNGNPTSALSCTEIVARTVVFNGHPTLDDSGCSALGAKSIGGSPVVLVE